MKITWQLHLLVLASVLLVACDRERTGELTIVEDGIVLDADVPGTCVFLKEKKLGTVPVKLSAADLTQLDVPNPRLNTNIIFNTDGFGECVYVIAQGKPHVNFTFAVPQQRRKEFVELETPWGIRTKHAGGSFWPQKSYRVKFMPITRSDGLSLSVDWQTNSAESKGWKLRATLSNHGLKTVAGVRPTLQLGRSIFSAEWKNIEAQQIELPLSWNSIAPNATLSTEMAVTPPRAKGDYAVYVIFSLLKDGSTNLLAGDGWCYSNTKMLAVNQDAELPDPAGHPADGRGSPATAP